MTRAPTNLLAARRLLLDHLDVDPDSVRSADLEPAEVGIVGDSAHRGGYHCGSDRVVQGDYSVVESSRDREGLTDFASALDVGLFSVTVNGRTHNLRTFSTWCVAQCVAGTPDTRDIREIIYSPDGEVVRRWDRLGRRATGYDSHLGHTHFSFFGDATMAGRDLTPLFRRYLTTIGLMTAQGGPLMFCTHGDSGPHVKKLQYRLNNLGFPLGTVDGEYGDATAASLKAALATMGSTADGRTYGPAEDMRLDILVIRKYAPAPAPTQPAPAVDVEAILDEAARRLAGGQS